jgi:hypothetical protein
MKKRRHLTWAEFWFFLFVVAMISLAFPPPAKADDITLSWTNPTDTVVESPGPAYTNPGGTRIWQLVAEIPDPEQAITSYVIPGMKPGTYQYVATTYDDQGVESRVSGKAEKVVTDFGVVDERVYIVAKITGNFLLLVVGTAPLGTPCNPDIEVNGMNAIPIDEVTFTGARDVIVVAKCG